MEYPVYRQGKHLSFANLVALFKEIFLFSCEVVSVSLSEARESTLRYDHQYVAITGYKNKYIDHKLE